jgi:hypothetical protein
VLRLKCRFGMNLSLRASGPVDGGFWPTAEITDAQRGGRLLGAPVAGVMRLTVDGGGSLTHAAIGLAAVWYRSKSRRRQRSSMAQSDVSASPAR